MPTLPRLFALMAWIGALATLSGCATTARAPGEVLSSGGVGVGVISQPAATMAASGGLAGKWTIEAAAAGLSAGAYLRPVAILLVPFTAAYGAARGVQCGQKLASAYPDASKMFPEVVEREFAPGDLREQFTNTLQKRTTARIVSLESPPDTETVSGEQHLLNATAQRALAYLLLVEAQSVDLVPLDLDCEQWAVKVSLRISLWSVADRKRIAGPLFSYPYVNAKLNDLKSIMDDAGVLRNRLAPNFEIAATNILEQRRFVLPQ